MADPPDGKWELVTEEHENFTWKTHRMRVEKGWLYRVSTQYGNVVFASMVYVHE